MNTFSNERFEQELKQFIKIHTPNDSSRDPYLYSLLPTGKLFRPRLAWLVCQDLGHTDDQVASNLGLFLELHHVYSLIHDDLPCMDDDDLRRGRASCHIRFNEWKALLTGDGLITLAHLALLEIEHPRLIEALKFCAWATGPKGLIHGQYIDLQESIDGLTDTLRIHELKTGRLMQIATCVPAILSDQKEITKSTTDFLRLGQAIGTSFQLIDDVLELIEEEVSKHEYQVNPILQFPKEALKQITLQEDAIKTLCNKYNLSRTRDFIEEYLTKMRSRVMDKKGTLEKHLGDNAQIILNYWETTD